MQFRSLKLLFSSDLILPFSLLLVYLLFLFIVKGVAPTSQELINTFSDLYSKYGYQIIFISALFESLILMNILIPGVIGMAMGAIFASTGQIELSRVILIASTGAVLGYSLNFWLGYLGFGEILKKVGFKKFIDAAKQKILKLGTKGLIIGFIYPTPGSLISFASGTVGMNFFYFLFIAILSVLFWFTLWGILFYLVGEMLLNFMIKYSTLSLVLVVVVIAIFVVWGKGVKRGVRR